MSTFSLGGRSFETKEQIKAYLRSNLYAQAQEEGDDVPVPVEAVLNDLIKFHPTYKAKLKGSHIVGFFVSKAPLPPGAKHVKNQPLHQRCYFFRREDGTYTDFSVNKCVELIVPDPLSNPASSTSDSDDNQGIVHKPEELHQLRTNYVRQALSAVAQLERWKWKDQQFRASRTRQQPTCAYTGEKLVKFRSFALYTVDIEVIEDGWATSMNTELADIPLLHEDNSSSRKLADADMEDEWREYYNTHADHILVSREGMEIFQLEKSMGSLGVR